MTTDAGVSQIIEVLVRSGGLEMIGLDIKLKPERIQEWLAANPGWRLESEKVLIRTRSFPTALAASHFAIFASGLASSLALPALLRVRGETVHITLYSPRTRSRAPLTEKVLDLASQLG
jgi:hypothetical protein